VNRLRQVMDAPGKKLIAYLTAGDPSADVTVDVMLAADRAGADVIELGVPFSDPSADGPAIQRAMQRSLAGGTGLYRTLAIAKAARLAGVRAPIVLFGYLNPIVVSGVDRTLGAAAAAGVDALLVVDLPVDEMEELAPAARTNGLELVPLVAPTSTAERMARVAALDAAFVYYISIAGVTGAALAGREGLGARIAAVKQAVRRPVAVGFGIATPDDARRISADADAVVVGTAIVKAIEANAGREVAAVGELVAALKAAISSPA
jgi:tryptophan synthase alpha chain